MEPSEATFLSHCLFTVSGVRPAGHAALVCICSKSSLRHKKKTDNADVAYLFHPLLSPACNK